MRKRDNTRGFTVFMVEKQILVVINLISKSDTDILFGNEFNKKKSLKVIIDLINLFHNYIN